MNSKLYGVSLLLSGLIFCTAAGATPPEPATITYTKQPYGYKREVTIQGLRVSDEALARLLNNPSALAKVHQEQLQYRWWWGSVGGISLGGGGVLLALLGSQPTTTPGLNHSLLVINQQVYANSPQNTVLLLAGTLLTAIGTYAAVQFLTDVFGFSERVILSDEEVAAMVQEYNQRQLPQSYIQEYWPVLQFSQRF